ncbi:MAG: glycosyltransferase family 2 protein [Patescibacteria group bacterium]|nr:glycosyltransferase family 2 protein [Patescibacteria group bacterium]
MAAECPPILFIIYRRPETTKRAFEAIRQARPAKLFVSQEALPADRLEQSGFAERHAEARAIATNVDWPCEVKTLFFTEHQGIIQGFKKSLDWFFENVEEGIMIEDDEIIEPTYFRFAAEMLEKYRTDTRVMCVTGSDALHYYDQPYKDNSYYFLSIPCVWGMATWRRAWKLYDPDVKQWPQVRDSKLLYGLLPTRAAAHYFSQKFQLYHDHLVNSWDGQWIFACLANKGLTIYPTKNLISNVGFGSVGALHKAMPGDDLWADLAMEPLSFPLKHPPEVAVNKVWDEYAVGARYAKSKLSTAQKLKWSVESTFPGPYIAVKRFFDRIFRPKQFASHDYKTERQLLP